MDRGAYLLTYLFTGLLTYLLTDLLTYSLTYLLTHLLTYLLTEWTEVLAGADGLHTEGGVHIEGLGRASFIELLLRRVKA